jgi:hypothetical protein
VFRKKVHSWKRPPTDLSDFKTEDLEKFTVISFYKLFCYEKYLELHEPGRKHENVASSNTEHLLKHDEVYTWKSSNQSRKAKYVQNF